MLRGYWTAVDNTVTRGKFELIACGVSVSNLLGK